MSRHELVIDANLLLLLVVGNTDPQLIRSHKRLKAYIEEDFDALREMIVSSNGVVVTPNIVTETSNLLDHIGGPARTSLVETLRQMIGDTPEEYVTSRAAASAPEFARIGLSDCAILDLVGEDRLLLTADFDLYQSANVRRPGAALNFNHLREARRGGRKT